MAEGNVYPSEEDFSYFCFDCRNTAEESEKDFFYVRAMGPCYTCSYCGDVFEAGFKREKVNSTGTASLRCKVCGKTFPRSDKLLHHSYQHSHQWPYRCSFCQKGFAVRSDFERHKRQRATVRKICCNKCSNYFQGKLCFNMRSDAYCEKCSDGSSQVEIARVRWQKVRCIPLKKTLLTSVLIAEIQQKKQKRISLLLVLWDLAIHAHSVVPCLKLDSREKMKSTDTPLHRCGICAKAFHIQANCCFIPLSIPMNGRIDIRSASKVLLYVHVWKVMIDNAISYVKYTAVNVFNCFRGKICLNILYLPTIDLFCEKCSNGPSLVDYVTS
ncbi:hypothetical protein TNIN_153971 [Trichonephila inaurata madagascariensis]|uniref:C2H2-type domain-containing protein n=1 Tax=Trichonephila inaurata madagascariensis TaxID=2747483 RepID=A0A8X6YMG7_9ARAC|nr:hypothetical protein TNIN_153971 [Trichonephila inaurata madagascariensis]